MLIRGVLKAKYVHFIPKKYDYTSVNYAHEINHQKGILQ